jgi:hypothetical protein
MQSYLSSSHILIKLEFSRQVLEKSSNTKFHENPSIGKWVNSCGRTDMTKPTVTFRDSVNTNKKHHEL